MKKNLIKIAAIVACASLMLACSKKEELSPSGSGQAIVGTTSNAEFLTEGEQIMKDVNEALKPKFEEINGNESSLSIGGDEMRFSSDSDSLFVSLPGEINNGRGSQRLLSGQWASANNEYGAVMININRSNVKEVIAWFTDKNENVFEKLFGEETAKAYDGTPANSFVFAPKLVTKKLPRGAFLIDGKIIAKTKKTLSSNSREISILGDAALNGFYIDKATYSSSLGGSSQWAYLVNSTLTEKDYLVANGTKYIGVKAGGKTEHFMFMFGLGKGSGAPKMSGIMIGVALSKDKQSAYFVLGAFGGVVVK